MTAGGIIKLALIAASGSASTAAIAGVMLLMDRLGLIKTHDLFRYALQIGSTMTVVSLAYALIYYRRQSRRAPKKP